MRRGGHRAERRIRAEFEAALEPGSFRLDNKLRARTDAMVFDGEFRGERAIFKVYIQKNARSRIRESQRELDYLHAALPEGPARVAPCLGVLPELNTMVLGFAPGLQVSELLKSAELAEREAVTAACGRWLATVSALRNKRASFRPRRFLDDLRGLDFRDLDAPMLDLASQTRRHVIALGRSLRGTEAAYAIAHNDFTSSNLHYDNGTVWAFDIQGRAYLPMARMVARFLVTRDIPSEPATDLRWGLDRWATKAFGTEGLLQGDDLNLLLPFFVGDQMLRRFVRAYGQPWASPHSPTRLAAYLEEIQREGVEP